MFHHYMHFKFLGDLLIFREKILSIVENKCARTSKIYFNTLIKIGGFLYYYKEKLAEKIDRKLVQFLQIYPSNEKITLKAIK